MPCASSTTPRAAPVPADMRAWVIRPERLGEPIDAMQLETVEVPEPGPGEVLVKVMAAGVNYNLVWAAMGKPVSIFRYTGDDFHIGGSDASGIVAAVGPGRAALEAGRRGRHPLQPVVRRVPGVQRPRPDGLHGAEDLGLRDELGLVRRLHARPGPAARAEAEHLSWEEAASYALVYFTAYRMLVDQAGVQAGDNVLVWGAGGGLGLDGAAALPRCTARTPSRSSRREDKIDLCKRLGAAAVIDRREFDLVDRDTGEANIAEMKRFGKTIRAATGGRDPDIVFEHVGAATFPTSVFVCKTFGKVVICGATSGFSLNFDVRYLWMRQKSIIGSHFANAYQATRANQLIIERKVMPVLMRTFPFAECPVPHQMMRENAHLGKMVVLVGAAEPGLGVTG